MNRIGVMGSPRSATAAGAENRCREPAGVGTCRGSVSLATVSPLRLSAQAQFRSGRSKRLPRKAVFVALPSRRVGRCCVWHANAPSRALPLDPAGARPCADPQTIGAKDAAVSSEVWRAPMSQAQRVARGRPRTRPAFQPRLIEPRPAPPGDSGAAWRIPRRYSGVCFPRSFLSARLASSRSSSRSMRRRASSVISPFCNRR